MLFDKPQWDILPAYVHEKWGSIDNAVNVCPLKGKTYKALVTVPTGLQSVFMDVLHIPPDDTVWLYLEEVPDDGWYLHAQWQGGSIPQTDIWRYPTLPYWAEKRFAVK